MERDLPVHVWGTSAPEEKVTVTFRGESRSASADRLGQWSLDLSPRSAGGPFQMKVQGRASGTADSLILLDDVLVGDVTGFEIAGADERFSPATARIEGETIIATSPAVPEPKFVRYGWANSPQCDLFNGEGLPASPFTSIER